MQAERRHALEKASAVEAQLAVVAGEAAGSNAVTGDLEARVVGLRRELAWHVEQQQQVPKLLEPLFSFSPLFVCERPLFFRVTTL